MLLIKSIRIADGKTHERFSRPLEQTKLIRKDKID